MIKFFRKIRKKTLTENKFGKYLIYAFGEIILVIIGILIALAINEQTKNRSNIELRDLYIIQLNDEADRNIKELNNIKNDAIEMLKELDTLRQLLVNKEYENPKLLSKSMILLNFNEFFPIMITYENLKFSGDLKLFDDLYLRNSISEAYGTFNNIKTLESIDEKGVTMYYENYVMLNVRFMNLSMSTSNYTKDAYFENTVLARRVTLRQNRDAYENSIESLKKLKITFSELKNENISENHN